MDAPKAIYISEEQEIYGFQIGDVLLAGMPIPGESRKLWDVMAENGLFRILCLTHDKAPYSPEREVDFLAQKKLLDHFDDVPEADLDAEAAATKELAAMGADCLSRGESVAAHCKGGTGRTGTVIGGILRILGYTWEETEAALIGANRLRGKYPGGWPESEWQRELVKNWSAG